MKDIVVTHIPGANKHRDHVRFAQLRVPGFHQLEELAEGITFLKETRVELWNMNFYEELWERKEWIPVFNKTHYLAFLPAHFQTSSPAGCCGGCQPPCVPWQDCSGTWQSEGLINEKHVSVTVKQSFNILASKSNIKVNISKHFFYFCHVRLSLYQRSQPSCQRAALLCPHLQRQSVCHISPSSPEHTKKTNCQCVCIVREQLYNLSYLMSLFF